MSRKSPKKEYHKHRIVFVALSLFAIINFFIITKAVADEADSTKLPVATTTQVPLTSAYSALNVPAIPAGGYYLDPTTGVKVWKVSSSTFPIANSNVVHDYAEGGDEISLPHTGTTRSVHYVVNGNTHYLVDFTPGVGMNNSRALTGIMNPAHDLSFTFSNNPATPYYAYIANGDYIRRFNFVTMQEASGDGWPVAGGDIWLHQAKNDSLFTWMNYGTDTVYGYEPSTGTLKTHTDANINEPRMDRDGRYIIFSMNSPSNAGQVWDWQSNTITWSLGGDFGGGNSIPFSHLAGCRQRIFGKNWNLSWPGKYWKVIPGIPNSDVNLEGGADASGHADCNWIQYPVNLDDQWVASLTYGGNWPPASGSGFLSPGGIVLWTANGQRRLLAHPYNTKVDYAHLSFAKFAPDGHYLMFTSDMLGQARSDIFLAEMPTLGSVTPTPQPSPIPTPPTLKGDLNKDGIVNSLDWSIMNSKWFTNDTTADLNNDGIVNSLDFSIMNGNWLKSG